tara:strand:+ start:5105 stop:5656 length:552 start_codon:yes stop_codon:yes gene_type:complete
MALTLRDKVNDVTYYGEDLEFMIDEESGVGEVYLDGDLVFQDDDSDTEELLLQTFVREYELTTEDEDDIKELESLGIDPLASQDTMMETRINSYPGIEEEEVDINEVEEGRFTHGGEYITSDTNEEFIGDYHIHPLMGAMIGKRYVMGEHHLLTPIDDAVDLRQVRSKGEPLRIIDYSLDEED